MDNHSTLTPLFFENLAKLFYAIAVSDKNIEAVEIETLKEVVNNQWSTLEFINQTNLAYIISIFDQLVMDKNLKSEACYKDFITYKNKNKQLFTETIKRLIIETGNAIASSFSNKNKSELIMLAKLAIEFKKQDV